MSDRTRNATLSLAARRAEVRPALELAVQAELRKSPYAAIRAVSCELSEGTLTLRGSVPSYYLKQVAQRLALGRLGGVAAIENRLQVER